MSDRFGSGLRALLVEDEDGLRIVLEEVLREAGFQVESVGALAPALEALAARPPDLVVTDKNLPDGNGLDLAKARAAGLADYEVVLITGYANFASAVEALRLGVADYVTKPFDSVELLLSRIQRITEVLKLRRKNHELVRELQDKNATLENMIVRDPLTGLFNHAFLQDMLEREVLRCRRNGFELALLVVDVDHFKEINDAHGHGVGDRLIHAIAGILTGTGRGSDVGFRLRPQDFVARYGGDVLAVVLPETDKPGAAARAERIRSHIEKFDFPALGLPKVTVSVGVASFPSDAPTRADLVSAADVALLAAKRSGRNQMMTWSSVLAVANLEDTGQLNEQIARLVALDRAILDGSFRFLYQPIVDAHTNQVAAYEALCRPQGDAFRTPIELIAAAEGAGRVAELGRVLRRIAVEPLERLVEPTMLFLNVHPLELGETLLDTDEDTVLPWASRIVLEITENTAVKKMDYVKAVLGSLKQRGFRIALDDLGAGYSSLNSLAQLEPDFVKLDMEMLRGIASDSRSARLIKHVLEFTKEEKIPVIAEGIETAEECAVVRDLGCEMMQGFLFCRPEEPFAKPKVQDQ